MMYSKVELNAAVEACERGVPVALVTRWYGIPRTTLQNQLGGRQSYSTAYQDYQRLSLVEE